MKQDKKKPYKSLFSNFLWSTGLTAKYVPWLLAFTALEIPLSVFTSWAGIYLPAKIVGMVTAGETLKKILLVTGSLMGALLLVRLFNQIATAVKTDQNGRYRAKATDVLNRKILGLFYQRLEKKETHDLCYRAQNVISSIGGYQPLTDMPRTLTGIITDILCYLLFGSVLTSVSFWVIPILTLAPVVSFFCTNAYQKWAHKTREERADLDRKGAMLLLTTDQIDAAKDIRIYGMADWFRDVFQDICSKKEKWDRRMTSRLFLSRFIDLFVVLLKDGAAYAILISMTLRGELTVEKFVFCFSAISSFASLMRSIVSKWNQLHKISLDLCDYREFLDLPDEDGIGEASIEPYLSAPFDIHFKNVTFRYDGANEDTLKDISFTLHFGEKLALVGLNGAGKTTLVKLLCGLYRPTSGEVTIGDTNIDKFYCKDYYKLFSCVFQDSKPTYFSLAEIVSGKENTDMALAESCIRKAGLSEKLDSLPNGIHTTLDKQLYEGATDFSGGEKQKLMLARALYKNAPVLVLDEPTAALDPIAENKIYMQYGEMTRGHSSLFISHRLASTRFCDRIFYLEKGRITEQGTHDELIALGGEYARLYELQSCWYREGGGKNEAV